MLDQAAMLAADPALLTAAQPTAQADAAGAARTAQADGTAAVSQGAIVLSDMIRVTNNLDARQPIPQDAQQQILRHLVLNVNTRDASSSVPYLGVTLDFLLDGRPVGNGQAVVPIVAMGADAPRLYYGNNVRFPQRGTYQVFVRMNRSPLLGQDQPPAAQFNLSVR
jgi:hypothetical protein